MTGPTVTVRHDEAAEEIRSLGRTEPWRFGVDVTAEITYPVGQHTAALDAVNRLAADLRRQIADAAETGAGR